MIELATIIARALESIYDPSHDYGFIFWYRTVRTGGATSTMMRAAFKFLSENKPEWELYDNMHK